VEIELQKIVEKREFMEMAFSHFRELNPAFEPAPDWTNCYFENIQRNAAYSLCWIMADQVRTGFVLYGIEQHRFLPRQAGVIYELYVQPALRRQGIAQACVRHVLDELWKAPVSKVHLEIVEANSSAQQFWRSLGFKKVSQRLALSKPLR
jgi:ribosomal protein S18 acetylase RimI-like enzyme